MTPGAAQTEAANQARRHRTEEKLRHVAEAIGQLQRRKLPVTYPAIASRAGVSRTFLYDNPAARDLVTAAITRAGSQCRHDQADHDAQAEASWQQRALNAEQALKAAHAEIPSSAPASASYSASSATPSTTTTAIPSSGLPPRTQPSNSASGTDRQQSHPGRTPASRPVQQPLPR